MLPVLYCLSPFVVHAPVAIRCGAKSCLVPYPIVRVPSHCHSSPSLALQQHFLIFVFRKFSLSFAPDFPLRTRGCVRALHRHIFKSYDPFYTAPDLAASKVRELLFLLRVSALLKRKKKSLLSTFHIHP